MRWTGSKCRRSRELLGFASNVMNCAWAQSEPPRSSGWVHRRHVRNFALKVQTRSSLCNLCVLCVSVVDEFRAKTHHRDTENTEVAQRNRIANVSYTGSVTHPLPRGGSDCVQQKLLTFETKLTCSTHLVVRLVNCQAKKHFPPPRLCSIKYLT